MCMERGLNPDAVSLPHLLTWAAHREEIAPAMSPLAGMGAAPDDEAGAGLEVPE